MKTKILCFTLLSIASGAIYSSEATRTGTLSPLKQKTIGSVQSITQAPHYSPWSWQHLKNLATLAIAPTPVAKALAQKHRAEFRKKMLEDEEKALKDLVDVNDPLWKNFEKFDEHYEKVIKMDNPDRQYDNMLSQEWIGHANQALEERGINPRSVHFLQENTPNVRASTSIEISAKGFLLFNYPLFWGHKIDPNLKFNQLFWVEHLAHLPYDTRQAILSHMAQHEARHFHLKHGVREGKIGIYHQLKQQTEPSRSALTAAEEKSADTLHTLESRENARNALTSFKHKVGYPEHKPDIKIEKTYHDVEHFQKQKQQIQKAAQRLQKTVQQHPATRTFTQSSQGWYNKAINAITAPYRWYKKNTE